MAVRIVRSAFRAIGATIMIFALFATVANAASMKTVSTANWDTCAALASGEVECWGWQLLGSTIYERLGIPVAVQQDLHLPCR